MQQNILFLLNDDNHDPSSGLSLATVHQLQRRLKMETHKMVTTERRLQQHIEGFPLQGMSQNSPDI